LLLVDEMHTLVCHAALIASILSA